MTPSPPDICLKGTKFVTKIEDERVYQEHKKCAQNFSDQK